jgi:hypothetical protein
VIFEDCLLIANLHTLQKMTNSELMNVDISIWLFNIAFHGYVKKPEGKD